MAVTPEEAHGVGDHEADEADHPGDGDRGRRQERGRQVDAALDRLDVGAQVPGGLFAERQQVERSRGREKYDDRQRGVDAE